MATIPKTIGLTHRNEAWINYGFRIARTLASSLPFDIMRGTRGRSPLEELHD